MRSTCTDIELCGWFVISLTWQEPSFRRQATSLRAHLEEVLSMTQILHCCITLLRTLNYGNYGIFLILGNAGFISSTVLNPAAGSAASPCRHRTVQGPSQLHVLDLLQATSQVRGTVKGLGFRVPFARCVTL